MGRRPSIAQGGFACVCGTTPGLYPVNGEVICSCPTCYRYEPDFNVRRRGRTFGEAWARWARASYLAEMRAGVMS